MRRFASVSLRGAMHVWRRNLTVYAKTWHLNVLPNFFEPVFMLLAFGLGIGHYVQNAPDGTSYLRYIAPGLIAYNAMMGASFEVTYNIFVKITFARSYESMLATPLEVEDIVLGEILWAVTRATLYGGIFLLIVTLFGAVEPIHALPVLLVLPLIGLLFASLGLVFTAIVPTIDLYSYYYTVFLTPLFLFSGVFFPVTDLPAWVQPVVPFTPLYHGVRVAQDFAHGRAETGTWSSVLVLAVSGVFLTLLAMKLMRRRLVK